MRFAKITSPGELEGYFGGDVWRTSEWTDGAFHGETASFKAEILPSDVTYKVSISAVDDPSDSDSFLTDDPARSIADFLGEGFPGGSEYFKKMSSSPRAFSSALRTAASLGSLNLVRRILASIPSVSSRHTASSSSWLEPVESKMKSRGWKVKLSTDDGIPSLLVDVSGVYSATVTIDEMEWKYGFVLKSDPSISATGTTDDPIRDFRKFYKSDEVVEARASAARVRDETATVPAKRR